MRLRVRACLAATLLVSGCGREEASPPTAPSAPSGTDPVAHLTVTIDSLGSAVAIPSVSHVRFDASGSVANQASVEYLIDYGDQTSSKEPVSEHTYEAPGEYRATVTVIDGRGRRASASQTVTARAVQGSWFHFAYNPRSHSAELRRLSLASQSGRAVAGELVRPTGESVAVTGTIEGERTLRLAAPGAQIEGIVPSQVFAEGAAFPLSGFAGIDGQPLPFTPIIGTPTGPPPVAKLHIQIDSLGSPVAIYRFSPVRYSADGSEADTPTYVMEFGDAEFTTGPTAVHPCTSATWFPTPVPARLTIVDRFGRLSTASRAVPCATLKDPTTLGSVYGWRNTIFNPSAGRQENRHIWFESQDGAALSGFYGHPEGNYSHFTGALSGERGIRIVLDGGGIEFTGEVILREGYSPGGGPVRYMDLAIKGGSANGLTLRFELVCGTYC